MRSFRAGLASSLVTCWLLLLATAAFAASPQFLAHVVGNTYSGNIHSGEFVDPVNLLALKFKTGTVSGEVTGQKTLNTTFKFEKNNVGGLAAQSLGDKSGMVLIAKVPGTLCYIDAATHRVGILYSLPADGVHIEVPALGQLIVIAGSFVGEVTPVEVEQLGFFTIDTGLGTTKCEGATGSEDLLSMEVEHNGTPLAMNPLVKLEAIKFAFEIKVDG